MRINSVAKLIILLLCMCCLFSGCSTSEPKTLYKSNSVEVVRDGTKTAVYDLVCNEEYNFTSKRVRRSDTVSEPYTAVDTDTIKIEIVPLGLSVYDKTENTVFSECLFIYENN